MKLLLVLSLVLVAPPGAQVFGKIFEKCELAWLLESKHDMPKEEVKSWVCIAEHESTFNTEAINHFKNPDGSKDYGLFQLNDKYWCGSDRGKNVCRMPCSALTDDDLTDDLKCIRRIIKDTERWKGPGTGLSAWVAYEIRCKYQNLDAYIAECYDGSHPSTSTIESQPIDNFIPRVPESTTASTSTTEMPSPSQVPGSDPTQNEVDVSVGKPGQGSSDPSPVGKPGQGSSDLSPVGKPGQGSSDLSPVGKPGPGSSVSTPVGKPGQGSSDPSPVGKPGQGSSDPSPVGKPGQGSSDLSPVGKPGQGSSDLSPVGKPGPGSSVSTPVGKPGDFVDTPDEPAIIPSARVPYPSHHELVVPEEISRRGSVAVHVRAGRLPQQVLVPVFG